MNLDDLQRQIAGLQIELRPVNDLMPYARNAKDHPEWQVALIAAAIKEFGWLVPAVIRDDGTLAAGHGRVLAALKLGLEVVPCIPARHLSETQIRAFALADNKLAELAPIDMKAAVLELQELKIEGFDIKLTGFDEKDLKSLDGKEGGADDDYTKKIEAPIYEPKGERPAIESLVDVTKVEQLREAIWSVADLPVDVRDFLLVAADRHAVFNYERIAEFYAHASPEVQALMEDSALVIIDFQKAIERGFVVLSEKLAEAYKDA